MALQTQTQISRFIASELNLSIATTSINGTEWHLIGVGNSSGIVASYQVVRNNSKACVELVLCPETKGFEIQTIPQIKTVTTIDATGKKITDKKSVIPREVENPKALIAALSRFMSLEWSLEEIKNGTITFEFVACCFVASQLGLEAMTDRQKLIGFANATEKQLERARDLFLESFPQFAIASQETVTIPSIASFESDTEEIKIKPSKAKMQAVKVA